MDDTGKHRLFINGTQQITGEKQSLLNEQGTNLYSWEGPRCGWNTRTAGTPYGSICGFCSFLLAGTIFSGCLTPFFGLLGAASWHVSHLVALRERKKSDTLDLGEYPVQDYLQLGWGLGQHRWDNRVSFLCVRVISREEGYRADKTRNDIHKYA